MATNLRLRPEAEQAVRAEAERSGRSQQEVIRDAVDRQLRLVPIPTTEIDTLVATGAVRPPRAPFQRAPKRIPLPAGVTAVDVIGREERLSNDRLRR